MTVDQLQLAALYASLLIVILVLVVSHLRHRRRTKAVEKEIAAIKAFLKK